MVKILVTGSDGRFGNILKKINSKQSFIFKGKKDLNILSLKSIAKNLKKFQPKYVLHLAGLSRPMSIHDRNLSKSIDLNIIGTSNIVKECSKLNIKVIYLSTSYVYPGLKGNYKETDSVRPWNNYSWSKLGGECAVQMYKNSLILRLCMTEKPFVHSKAFGNVKSNFIFQEDAAKLILKILNKKGILNIGGKSQSIYNFAKQYNKKIKKIYSKGEFPKKIYMNLTKLKNYLD
ncbi:sugar nucleotide-binding protein [Pelagibacteraceae bacterium]|nr:sugar nucleotide-binding protein [Pelagibacteraceae bacterium]